jgi:hypothetical protein
MRAGISVVFASMVSVGAAAGPQLPSFSDQTIASGLSFLHETTATEPLEIFRMTPGAGVGDFDRDGYLDVLVQGGVGQNARLYMNNGDGTFTDAAAAWGIDLTAHEGSSVAVGDIDTNGYLDILAANVLGRIHLYQNTGLGTFDEVAVAANVAYVEGAEVPSFGVAFGDVDLDGDLDMVRSEWQVGFFSAPDGNRLLFNDGTGVFADVTQGTGCFEDFGLAAFTPALVDMNGDFLPELTVAADFATSKYYRHGGDHYDEMETNGTCTDENGMGSAIADFDNDGDLDWFVTSIYDGDGVNEGGWGMTGNRLYRNEGNDQYTDVTDLAGVRDGQWGWGASFGDLNLDGLLDLAMTNGMLFSKDSNPDPDFMDDETCVWINTGDFKVGPTYIEVAAKIGVNHTAAGKGLISFDADNDGDLDMLITSNRAELAYYRNDSAPAPNQWLQLDVISPSGVAPDGIGAKVNITVGDQTYYRDVFGGPSFICQEPLRVHFGFPATPTIDVLEVQWPDGRVSVRTDVPTGQILCVLLADLDLDGMVGISDLLVLLANWADCDAPCPGDTDANGMIDTLDLLQLLASWGRTSWCAD